MKLVESSDDFKSIIKETPGLVVVDFYADWCGPCRMMSPVLEKWSEEYPDVKFIKINVDENPEIAEELDVSAMPTFILYKGGSKLDTLVGANKDKLLDKITTNMK